MSADTVKLSGRDLLWHEAKPAVETARFGAWRRHLLVILALVAVKLMTIASSDGVELVTTWLNDSRSLLGWP